MSPINTEPPPTATNTAPPPPQSLPSPSSPPTPKFNFTYDPSLTPYTVSLHTFLQSHPEYDAIATGSLVFWRPPPSLSPSTSHPPQSPSSSSPPPRILLQKRAAHDSMPGRWETPGGGCDLDDESVLHAAARELWEESRLVAGHVAARVGGEHVFFSRRGMRIGKLNFVVEVVMDDGAGIGEGEGSPPRVQLDANEHEDFVWASEGECRAGKIRDGRELVFTTRAQEEVVYEAFGWWKKRGDKEVLRGGD
ncbi:NUDIX hydrolase domain-like protein [Coniochaeta sp. 2T2.1]|nr:NUDIX hydrolase domain-like protein [Coniochaeta sp. 2T2.1]